MRRGISGPAAARATGGLSSRNGQRRCAVTTGAVDWMHPPQRRWRTSTCRSGGTRGRSDRGQGDDQRVAQHRSRRTLRRVADRAPGTVARPVRAMRTGRRVQPRSAGRHRVRPHRGGLDGGRMSAGRIGTTRSRGSFTRLPLRRPVSQPGRVRRSRNRILLARRARPMRPSSTSSLSITRQACTPPSPSTSQRWMSASRSRSRWTCEASSSRSDPLRLHPRKETRTGSEHRPSPDLPKLPPRHVSA